MDLIVIGAGPAGIMAAIRAAKRGAKVTVLEKNKILCKKLRITGKGRCNITNACELRELFDNIPRNPKFLMSCFNNFSNYDIISFFEENHLPTVVERGMRVFPQSQNATDVANCLINTARQAGVHFINECTVTAIICNNEGACGVRYIQKNKEEKQLMAQNVLIATGGMSYPLTGSTGDGYTFAAELGHSIIATKPSLCPLISDEFFIGELEGCSLRNIEASLIINNEIVFTDFGEMVFTRNGVSGPVILSASSHYDEQTPCRIEIDLKPALDNETLDKRILRDFSQVQNKIFSNALDALLPRKLIPVFIMKTGIDPKKQVNSITAQERAKILYLLKHFDINIVSKGDISEAIVTSGGVCVKEINPKTMESKLCKGLFFAGEVIDVDGYTGGFNLTIAFSTGYAAGENIHI
ncbi:MAG: NAD(P)/FAD-dependent oxidoreductase [Ruminococcaceae bacterium]|nr:NAD(P)/FAD-dependent oxidoreductase [Oscillospiraceae bacterium]